MLAFNSLNNLEIFNGSKKKVFVLNSLKMADFETIKSTTQFNDTFCHKHKRMISERILPNEVRASLLEITL